MEMQDKEFDNVFSTKLDNFEVEPSKAVWQGINDGLGNNNRKKVLPFLSIAASIIVLIAAGVVFLTQKTTVVKPHVVKDRVAVNHPTKVIPATTALKLQNTTAQGTAIAAATVIKPKHIEKNNIAKVPLKQVVPIQQQNPVQPQGQQILASATVPKNDVAKPAVIDTANVIAAVPLVHPQVDKPATIAATVPTVEKIAEAPPVKKRHLRSFGDILNVVIATVDKRKDKVIEFSNTDDDESTITGVNLGIIKIKKQN
jgi:hypothetical protein